ncbi:MAG TPA: hypothetical protein VH814_13625 [Steroidobacteraceae bacterium]|jgi:hypothetical protein
MSKNSTNAAFDADLDHRLTALTVTVLAFIGGILSLIILASIAVNALSAALCRVQ